MRVDRVVIINDFSVARGGATALALLSAELFAERAIPVTFFCGDNANDPDREINGVEFVGVKGKPLLELSTREAMVSGMYNTTARDALKTLISQRDTPNTIYHVHAWSLILSPSIFKSLQPVANRVITHSHDQFLACPNGVYFDFRKHASCNLKPLDFQCLVTNCDKRSYLHKGWRAMRQGVLARTLNERFPWAGIVLIHPDLEPRLKRFGYAKSNMVTVRNPVVPFSKNRVRAEDNHELFFVGRVEIDKGVLELARAAKAAQMSVTIVGEGPLSAQLAEEFPDITLEGWHDKKSMAPILQRARALVMPSRFAEPFGLVAVEAIQSGVPALVSDDTFLAPEIVAAGVGFSCNIHCPEDFSNALKTLKNLPKSEMKAMSQKGFANEAPLGLTPQSWCDSLLDLYDTALENANLARV